MQPTLKDMRNIRMRTDDLGEQTLSRFCPACADTCQDISTCPHLYCLARVAFPCKDTIACFIAPSAV
jgi:hypothetical protein